MKVIRRRPGIGYIDTLFWVPKDKINVEGVKNALTFQFFEKKSVQFLTLWRETTNHLLVPREFWDTTAEGITFPIIDCRPSSFPTVDIRSKIRLDHRYEGGQLHPTGDHIQEEALDKLLTSRGGILQLACGKGKTVVALELTARKRVPTLIVVDTTQLVRQWREEIELHLEVPGGVGMLGDGEFDWNHPIVIATYHTLANRAATFPEEVRRRFGLIIWDEAHHVAAPKFSRSADLFLGQRVGLTATPIRSDGMHVVYSSHIGNVLYKNLTQELKPEITFEWSGIQITEDALSHLATHDKNGEIHLGKLAGYFATRVDRLDFILNKVRKAIAEGRKIIVLSKSVDESINLLARWNGRPELYTDIPYPTAHDVGEVIPPAELEKKEEKELNKKLAITITQLQDKFLNTVKRDTLQTKKKNIEFRLAQHRVWLKTEKLYRFHQREYLKDLLQDPSTGGLMIYKVDADKRTELLRSKQVTFSIMKYGREGLNERSLDTIITCEPVGDEGAIQQLLGRILRVKIGKQAPHAIFIEDDVGILIGMCTKIRQMLREWPAEDGGPFDYTLVGHPSTRNRRQSWTSNSPRT